LLDRVRAGDLDAYGVLVRRFESIAVRTATLLGAGSDAQDVAQEAFVKAYRSLGGFQAGSPFRPWLLAIVANETRNLQRSARRRSHREESPIAQQWVGTPIDPADSVIAAERRTAVLRELDRLGAHQRDVLVCRYLLELDERETAAMLGLSPGTVKSRSSRALRRLRDRLSDDAPTASEEVDRAH